MPKCKYCDSDVGWDDTNKRYVNPDGSTHGKKEGDVWKCIDSTGKEIPRKTGTQSSGKKPFVATKLKLSTDPIQRLIEINGLIDAVHVNAMVLAKKHNGGVDATIEVIRRYEDNILRLLVV